MALDFGKPTTFPTFAFALSQTDGLSGTNRGGAPQQQERPNMGPFLGCRASASILLLHKEREVEREREIDRSIDPTSTWPKVLLDKGWGSG